LNIISKKLKMPLNKVISGLLFFITSIWLNPGLRAQSILEIWEIQGVGAVSLYTGQWVESRDNIVVATKYDGFFLQTPMDRSDQDPRTSDGIFVYTGGHPEVQVGDRVDIRGFIGEQNTLTQFESGSDISILSSGGDLPPPVLLDANFPDSFPSDPPALEQVEGMRVRFEGIASGPTNLFGEFAATATGRRAFREPGILYPGLPGLPVWDGNPEIFWVDPDGAGAPDNRLITPNTTFAATGVMTFQFEKYTLFPELYTLRAAPPGQQVRERRAGEFTVGSLNAFLLLKSEPGYQRKLNKLAKYIVGFMGAPDILALQEVESPEVLTDLIAQIRQEDNALSYTSHFESGPEYVNVSYLTSSRIVVESVEQLGRFERASVGGLLHNRPPLCLNARLGNDGPGLQLLNVHIRSRLGIEEADSAFVRRKRYEQALSIARMVQERQGNNLMVLGDFNAYPFTDGYVDVVNQIAGLPAGEALFPHQEIVNPPLRNLTAEMDSAQRYSYIRDGNAQLLDHCLAGEMAGLRIEGLQFSRGNADAPFLQRETEETALGSSDHDGFVVFLQTDRSVAAPPALSLPGVDVQYTNPMRAGATISVENTGGKSIEMCLFSSGGVPLQEWEVMEQSRQRYALPENLAPGAYLLIFRDEGRQASYKLVIF
jgi:endonuclease/exonuclease/phosphatase family metal-dependent hydrolase